VHNQAEPIAWALLCLPVGKVISEWRLMERTGNGAFYARKDGLLARCRGIQTPEGVRWWHCILGRKAKALQYDHVVAAVRTFFPGRAMVLQVWPPSDAQDDDERAGHVVHLWWAVDGNSGVPPVSTWENEAWIEEREEASTWE